MTSTTAAEPLTSLEIATNALLGRQPGLSRLPVARDTTPRAAVEAVVLAALRRPPCVVSFSGGRDSSSVLAVAAHVARREGLPLPVPVSLRFPAVPSADESSWQEAVVRHLDLPDWERPEFADELDVLGPYALRALRARGLLWPVNTYVHLPVFERARGGSALTGFGGDEALLPARFARVNQVLGRQVRPGPADVLRLAFAYGPRRPRGRVLQRRAPVVLPWLRPATQRAYDRARAREFAAEAVGWGDWLVSSWWPSRLRATVVESFQSLAADFDITVAHPLQEATVLAALSGDGGRLGHRSRGDAVAALFGDVLPEAVVRRRDKASFNAAFYGPHLREFARSWDGRGIDPALVDGEVLRREWLADQVNGRSTLLLHAAWLASAC